VRIDLAYCIELKRVVDIQEACQAFAARANRNISSFHFLCEDGKCRYSNSRGVRVSAPNHWRVPQENVEFTSPHFRKLDEHSSECVWSQMHEAAEEEAQDGDETPDIVRVRRALQTRLITRFIIPDADEGGDGSTPADELKRIRDISHREDRYRELRKYLRGEGSTATNLEALVSCYEELKSKGEDAFEFAVNGHGRTSFRHAFRHFLATSPRGSFHVLYGGAHLTQRYGRAPEPLGFSLTFMDRMMEPETVAEGGTRVTLYLAHGAVAEHRSAARIRALLDEMEANKNLKPYLKVYWIGEVQRGTKGMSAICATPAHLVMRIKYPERRAHADPTTAVDS